MDVDYMIATSACRVAGARQTGDEFFGWILQNYNLNNQNRALVEAERGKCSQGAAPQALRAMLPASLVGITYHGKGGTELRASSSGNGTSEAVEAIPPETFSRRLFQASDAPAAVAQVSKLVGPAYQVQSVPHFVLATPAAHSPILPDSPDSALPGRLTIPDQDSGPNLGGVANRAQTTQMQPMAPNVARRPDPAPANSMILGNVGLANQGPPPLNARQMPPLEAVSNAPTSVLPPRAATPNAPSDASIQVNTRPGLVQGPAQHPISVAVDDADFKNAGEDLERYLQFFTSEYRMPAPKNLITVYFASSRPDLEKLARTLHGIQLPVGSIGYSFPADQSMVGWADGKAYGTFAHELFHLTVRNGFGDIPPWLDEGMAALYEVSRFEGSRAVGLPNWRGEILRRLWAERPSIKDLVQMNRGLFDDVGGDSAQYVSGERQAVNHATARYFLLYLQTQNRVLTVYNAFRQREVNDHPARQATELLESTLRSSLDAVDADFARWFKQLPE